MFSTSVSEGLKEGVICSQYKGQQNEWQTSECEDGVEKKEEEIGLTHQKRKDLA